MLRLILLGGTIRVLNCTVSFHALVLKHCLYECVKGTFDRIVEIQATGEWDRESVKREQGKMRIGTKITGKRGNEGSVVLGKPGEQGNEEWGSGP